MFDDTLGRSMCRCSTINLPRTPPRALLWPGDLPPFGAGRQSAAIAGLGPDEISHLMQGAEPNLADCEFEFIGGAGETGPYLDAFKRSFDKAGIQHVTVPSHTMNWGRLADDVRSVPDINDLAYAKSLVGMPEMKAAARHSLSLGNEQYNLGGYSYGAAKEAAKAYAVAENGGRVDNLVLLGAPINQDLYDAVRHHPNIKNVITLNLGAYGDPIHAGMSDAALKTVVPELAMQWPSRIGHFSYSGDGPSYDAPARPVCGHAGGSWRQMRSRAAFLSYWCSVAWVSSRLRHSHGSSCAESIW